jgi:hypothetical protein
MYNTAVAPVAVGLFGRSRSFSFLVTQHLAMLAVSLGFAF